MAQDERFREVQRFDQPWLWVVALGASLPPLAALLMGTWRQLVLGRPFGARQLSDGVLAALAGLVSVVVVGTLGFLGLTRLEVAVRDDGLHLAFRPFVRRVVRPEQIVDARVRTYHPLREYGGWGVRFGRAGRALTVRGRRGVQLELADGERLLVGSQRPDALLGALGEIGRD